MIMTFLRPKDLLKFRGVNKNLFIFLAESSMFLGIFRAQLKILKIHELEGKIDQYLPNLSLRVHQELKLVHIFKRTLPLEYFNFKVKWILYSSHS